jgi:hypothetical protein
MIGGGNSLFKSFGTRIGVAVSTIETPVVVESRWVRINASAGDFYTIPTGCELTFDGTTWIPAGTYKLEGTASYDDMIRTVSDTYDTGWMKGDIRRAFICETLGTTVAVSATVADRSVKATSLALTGALTFSPVATGAELQWISGFSASNYLSQPYSADLDFGTGDFYITGWLFSAGDVAKVIVTRISSPAALSCFILQTSSTGTLEFAISNNGFSTFDSVKSTTVINNSILRYFTAIRRGSKIEMWINGVKENETSIVIATGSLSHTTAEIRVGNYLAGGSSFSTGKISMIRIGAGSLSAAQIAKMYNDELLLF